VSVEVRYVVDEDVTLLARVAPEVEAQARWLLEQVLARLGERPPGLRDGTTLRLGWSVLTLRAHEGALVVHEPDFARPGALKDDITASLEVLGRQGAVCQRVQAAAQDARWDQHVVVAPGAFEARRVFLRRDEADGPNDTGWRILVDDDDAPDDPGAYRMFPVAHLLSARPALLAALALPTGWIAVEHGDALVGVADAEDQERWG
jgi:hypothetical protein